MTLLVGYVYAHKIIRLRRRWQLGIHAAVLVLPIGILRGWVPPTASTPIFWLLGLLAAVIGLPFFAVTTTSPLLQAWFSRTGHRSAADPYFLYAASNVGSLLGLLGYPFLIQPLLRLGDQALAWSIGYGVFALAMGGCMAVVWRLGRAADGAGQPPAAPDEAIGRGRRLRWLLLALAPSSLMMSVTTYLSTAIAPIPLLWVVPLSLYLLTFILVFAGRQALPHWLMARALPIVALPLVLTMLVRATQPVAALTALHLAAFFVAAMVCHGALAAARPGPRHLTEFYLWMSAGGALGGAFNALVAPLIFNSVIEYQIGLALVCGLLWRPAPEPSRSARLDVALPAALGLTVAIALALLPDSVLAAGSVWPRLVFALAVLACFSFSRRPLRFGLGVAALFLPGGALYDGGEGRVLFATRSFFGAHRVVLNEGYRILAHGSTLHGIQSTDPARSREPLSYYTASGPAGQVFVTLGPAYRRVAVVGLGSGALACYSRPGQEWAYYEIDPVVERIARDPRYFTYLRDCAPQIPVVLGDARIKLADGQYDAIVLDAYSSDAIPIHLITREALALYLRKLALGGALIFHISNIYFDLKPVLGNLAADAGLTVVEQDDLTVDAAAQDLGKRPSQWAVLARAPADLGGLAGDARWRPLAPAPDGPLWPMILPAF